MVKNNTMDMDEGFSEGVLPFFKEFLKCASTEERYGRHIRNEAFAGFNDESLVAEAKKNTPSALFAVKELAFYRTDPKALEEVANSRQDYIGKFARYMLALRRSMVGEGTGASAQLGTTQEIFKERDEKRLLELARTFPNFSLFLMYKLYPSAHAEFMQPYVDVDVVKKAVNIALYLKDVSFLKDIFVFEIHYRVSGFVGSENEPRKEVLDFVIGAFNKLWPFLSSEKEKRSLLDDLEDMMELFVEKRGLFEKFSSVLEDIRGMLRNMLKEGYISPMDFENVIKRFLDYALRMRPELVLHIDPFLDDLIGLKIDPLEKAEILTNIAEKIKSESSIQLSKIINAIIRLQEISTEAKVQSLERIARIAKIARSTGNEEVLDGLTITLRNGNNLKDVRDIIQRILSRRRRVNPLRPVGGCPFGNSGNPTRRPKK